MKAALAIACLLQAACGLKVGLIGDSGYGSGAEKSFSVMRSKGVDVVVHNGDFDYDNNPNGWARFLDNNWLKLGKEHLLMAQGNHDLRRWGGYKQALHSRMSSGLKSACRGRQGKSMSSEYGEWMSCEMDDVHMIVLGWNAAYLFTDAGKYIDNEFSNSNARWKVCVWHRPEGTYNPGPRYTNQPRDRSRQGEWQMYEACRNHGAIIVGGHTHMYTRSKLMSNFQRRTVASDSARDLVKLSCGKSIDIVSGMGGVSNVARGKRRQRRFIENRYNRRVGRQRNGVLICDFPDTKKGEGERATCEFVVGGSPGQVTDRFQLTNSCRKQ